MPAGLLAACAFGAFSVNASARTIELFGWVAGFLAAGSAYLIDDGMVGRGYLGAFLVSFVGFATFVAIIASGDFIGAVIGGLSGAVLVGGALRSPVLGAEDPSDEPQPASAMVGYLIRTWLGVSALAVGVLVLAALRM
jgi:hypothetical protein